MAVADGGTPSGDVVLSHSEDPEDHIAVANKFALAGRQN